VGVKEGKKEAVLTCFVAIGSFWLLGERKAD
jgi:hypothetical protein